MNENSVGRGVIILAISSIVLKILSALYMPILSTILTDDGISIYYVGYTIFVFLFALTSLGVQPAIAKLVAEQTANGLPKDALKVLKLSKRTLFIYGGIVSIIFAISAIPLSIVLNSKHSMLSFIFLSPAITLAAILSAYRGYFQGCNDMVALSISNIIEQVLNVTFSLFFAYQFMKTSIPLGSAGGTIGTSIGAVGAILYFKYVLANKSSNSKLSNNIISQKNEILRNLLIYSVPLTLVVAIQNFAGIVDLSAVRWLIVDGVPMSTATLHYYNVIINVPLAIITALGIGIFPKIIKCYLEKNKKELVIQTAYCYKLIYIVTIPAVCGLTILSREIFKFLFNRDVGYEILLFGSVALIFMSISSIQNVIFQGLNKFKFIIKIGLLTLSIKLFFNILLIRFNSINIIGVALGNILAFMMAVIINHIELQKSFDIKIPIINQVKIPMICSAIMSIILLLIRNTLLSVFIENNFTRASTGITTFILIVVGGAIYSLSMVLLGGISKYELDTVSPVIYKLLPYKLKQRIC